MYASTVDGEASQAALAEAGDRPRILLAGIVGFPNGEGATSRIHAYAKGLRAAGCDVRVVCLRWSERTVDEAKNRQAEGTYCGIPFTYTSGSPYRPSTFMGRRLRDARSAIRFARMVCATPGRRPAHVIFFENYAGWIILTAAVCRFAGSACVIERSEYPFVYAPDTLLMRLWARMFTRSVYRLVDGVIVISTCLERYFLARIRRGARVIRIPILVDLDEFKPSEPDVVSDGGILCYVGHLDHPGEIRGLLEAFAEVAERFPKWRVRIVGGSSEPSALVRLQSLTESLHLGERVEFTGKANRADLPRLLGEASAFALPRASGLFSTAGFPTKLGEYLATGRPVVITATGDIPLYLRDGVDAYLVPPDDTPAFAARLADVFADPVAARVVGARGRETAQREFETMAQCRRLASFMAEIGRSDARSRSPRVPV